MALAAPPTMNGRVISSDPKTLLIVDVKIQLRTEYSGIHHALIKFRYTSVGMTKGYSGASMSTEKGYDDDWAYMWWQYISLLRVSHDLTSKENMLTRQALR